MARKKLCEYYWAPFKSDCEELLGRFQQTESVRYEEFSDVWREMDFSITSLYRFLKGHPHCGTHSDHEKRSFTQLAFTNLQIYSSPIQFSNSDGRLSSSRADMLAAIKSKSYGDVSKREQNLGVRQVEMVTSDSETDQALFIHKKRPPSLRTRTWQNFGKPGEPEPTQEWLLCVMEEDQTALKHKDRRRFKW